MRENMTCQNLHGTLMHKDIPLIFVEMDRGRIQVFEPRLESIDYFPFLLRFFPNEHRFKEEMVSRLFPPTRQNLQSVLDELGLTEYNVDGIIAANYALNINDCRWFKPYGSSLVYADVKVRD